MCVCIGALLATDAQPAAPTAVYTNTGLSLTQSQGWSLSPSPPIDGIETTLWIADSTFTRADLLAAWVGYSWNVVPQITQGGIVNIEFSATGGPLDIEWHILQTAADNFWRARTGTGAWGPANGLGGLRQLANIGVSSLPFYTITATHFDLNAYRYFIFEGRKIRSDWLANDVVGSTRLPRHLLYAQPFDTDLHATRPRQNAALPTRGRWRVHRRLGHWLNAERAVRRSLF